MFDFLNSMWGNIQGALNSPDPMAAANTLASTGDPNAFANLFPDAKTWSPTALDPNATDMGLNMTPNSFNQGMTILPPGANGLPQMPPVISPATPSTGTNFPSPGLPEGVPNPATPPVIAQPTSPAAGIEDAATKRAQLTAQQMKELMGMQNSGEGKQLPPPSKPDLGRGPTQAMQQLQTSPASPMARATLASLIYGRR